MGTAWFIGLMACRINPVRLALWFTECIYLLNSVQSSIFDQCVALLQATESTPNR